MILTAEEKSKVAEDAKESLRVHCVLPQRHRGKKTSPPNSGVSAYEIEDDFIIVQFSDDTTCAATKPLVLTSCVR